MGWKKDESSREDEKRALIYMREARMTLAPAHYQFRASYCACESTERFHVMASSVKRGGLTVPCLWVEHVAICPTFEWQVLTHIQLGIRERHIRVGGN